MATLKGENAGASDEALAQYREHLARVNQQVEEARSQREAAIAPTDERQAEILRYFQNTPYRKRDEET